MVLVPGTRLGPYEITATIGAGGMGEVYRATDLRLGRDVAIKVLPADVATHDRPHALPLRDHRRDSPRRHLDAPVSMHHDASMRTTLTLDPDVARMVAEEVHRVRKPLKQVVNQALRRGLTAPGRRRRLKPYRVRPHAAHLLPGIDRARLNALADEQEDSAIAGLARRPQAS